MGLFNFPPFDASGSTGFLDPALAYQARSSLLGPQQTPMAPSSFGAGGGWNALMGLGAGLASGGAPGGGGWGAGIGKGLALGQNALSDAADRQAKQQSYALQLALLQHTLGKDATDLAFKKASLIPPIVREGMPNYGIPDTSGGDVSGGGDQGMTAPQYNQPVQMQSPDMTQGAQTVPLYNGQPTLSTPAQLRVNEKAAASRYGDTASLRKDVLGDQGYKLYSAAAPIYLSMEKTKGVNTTQGDLNFILGAAKIYDPGSIVRTAEGERIAETGSIPEQIRGAFNAAKGGARLNPTQRAEILAMVRSRMRELKAGAENMYSSANEFAKSNNLGELSLPKLINIQEDTPETTTSAAKGGWTEGAQPVFPKSFSKTPPVPTAKAYITQDGKPYWYDPQTDQRWGPY